MAEESSETPTEPAQPDETIEEASRLIHQLQSGQLLYTSVELGIVELLDDDPIAASEVAAELDLHADNTYRLLRALDHYGVLEEREDRQFTLTPVGELFQTEHPDSLREVLLFDRSPEWILPMLHLTDIVREGGPDGFVREFGSDIFEYAEANPGYGEVLNAYMSFISVDQADRILDALEPRGFSQFSDVCDVGGGHGNLLCHVLAAHPHLEGTVLELPGVIAEEDQLWAPKLGVDDRCTYVAGDMFEAVPAADAYFLKFILHDWDDEDCVRILSTIHDAAPPDGRLFVVEEVVPGPGVPHDSKRLDVAMMVHTGGRERTEAEYAALLGRADWELVETWEPEEGEFSVLEAARG